MPKSKNVPDWFQQLQMPTRLRGRIVAGFSFHRDGYVRWYDGATRQVCGKKTPPEEIEDRWEEKKREIDALPNRGRLVRASIRDAAIVFYAYLNHRVKTGQPEPMSATTAEDYKKTINHFGRFVGPETGIDRIDTGRFSAYAQSYGENSPSTFFRVVAYVRAFFQWCRDEGLIDELPQFGRYFIRPSLQDRRDVRLGHAKSHSPEQICRLWFYARFEEKLWMALGLNGALDNADIANLTHDVLDRDRGVLDYRRRKRGKVRRIIPVLPIVWEMLDWYERPEPANPEWSDRVFLTPTGLPLQRHKPGKNGYGNPIDYVSTCWTRLLIRCGFRDAYERQSRRIDAPKRTVGKRKRGEAGGQGFRALRTTFTNLAPHGYRDEVELITGHASGGVLIENYLEEFGVGPLKELVEAVWAKAFTSPEPRDRSRPLEDSTVEIAS
jgi:integrase